MTQLIPNYTDIDYQTMVARLKSMLKATDTFKDYDFEGANISVLLELTAYVGDLQTFFANKLAQQIHPETANIYEVVHSLARQKGYEPSGYVAAKLDLDVVVNLSQIGASVNDTLDIPRWFSVDSGGVDDNVDNIYYCTVDDYSRTLEPSDFSGGIEDSYVTLSFTMRQGIPVSSVIEYVGSDIVSNQIVLPFLNWDTGSYPYSDDANNSILVTVNDVIWERVDDFYDDISGLVNVENAYVLSYDKYKRYVLKFSNARNVPSDADVIKVIMIETLGEDGNVGTDTFYVDNDTNDTGNKPVSDTILGTSDVAFLTLNITAGGGSTLEVVESAYTIRNTNPSSGGANPQDIEELKDAGRASAHSQKRNVTSHDYKGDLEKRSDISIANAWGEQEQNPDTLLVYNYNKAYLSIIPKEFDEEGDTSNIIQTSYVADEDFTSLTTESTLDFPTRYNPSWSSDLLEYLEPKKMLGIREEFVLPELVYFRIDFGLRVKRTYNWSVVRDAIKQKVDYYFETLNRVFGDTIDFRDIENYIIDPSIVSETNDFAAVRGIDSLVIRDVLIHRLLRNTATTTGGSGTGLKVTYRVDAGAATDVEIYEAGEGYVNAEVVTIDGGFDNAELTLSVSAVEGSVASVVLGGTNTGYAYDESGATDDLYIYDDNTENDFPHFIEINYSEDNADGSVNTLKSIQLGHNQFPRLSLEYCKFINEG